MPLLLMLWCNVVKRNWTIILMQTVLYQYSTPINVTSDSVAHFSDITMTEGVIIADIY